ncbi:UDP-2,4-diacetamido-2,4, 6-trideoxy-beta-L-altropyranose hydrolase [Burkholderia multivorans]
MNVFFRVDASLQTGSGHLMRCLALADAIRPFVGQVRFLCRHLPEALDALVHEHGHEVSVLPAGTDSVTGQETPLAHAAWLGVTQERDARDTLAAIGATECAVLIVDHYGIDARWERIVRAKAKRMLAIDDLADRAHVCDWLLDQNLYADMAQRYRDLVPPHCECLLGPDYALLRPEFLEQRLRARPRSGTVRRILVFFGGVDAANHTGTALAALQHVALPDVAVDVVVGAQHPDLDGILTRCAAQGYECHVQTTRMAELMARADLCIGAGGSATWERCCVGLPAIAFVVADNQRDLVATAAAKGLLLAPDVHPYAPQALAGYLQDVLRTPERLAAVSRAAFDAVQGTGADRVRRAIGISSVTVRRATPADARMLFAWRNHEKIRKVSRNSVPIEWEQHRTWVERVIGNPRQTLLIGTRQGTPVGVVRYDLDDGRNEAEISIYLDPAINSRGLGSELLCAAEARLREDFTGIGAIRAEVLGDNVASHRLFQRNGYARVGNIYTKRLLP